VRKLKHIVFILALLLGDFLVYGQNSEADLKSQADKLYANKQYVEATKSYLQLLSIQPRDAYYNLRYGTCLLYNSKKKQDAIKYLEYASKVDGTLDEVFFYLGKAYHLNYRFNEAINAYQTYKTKVGAKVNKDFEVDQEIQASQNGKKLLTSLNELIVYEKKEYSYKEFFRLYNLKDIGGDIIVGSSFQSKIDKKENHIPIIHFPANATKIFHSSYGENAAKSKDICMRQKLPNGTWSAPITIEGGVNTAFDEDFPFWDEKNQYLYFSSKGHNTMGGYDVFRCKFDASKGVFGPAENLDFPISSADDDLFYIADSLGNLAYFASARQSQDGKIHVYKVRVKSLPSQLIALKGSIESSDNSFAKAKIKVVDTKQNLEIGTFDVDNAGNYLITLPKEGEYEYTIYTANKEEYKSTFSIGKQREFKPIKQKINVDEASKIVKIENLFNEAVDDPIKVLAEVLKQKSELDPNAKVFGTSEEGTSRDLAVVLKELNLNNQSYFEAKESIKDQVKRNKEAIKDVDVTQKKALTSANYVNEEITRLREEVKKLSNTAETKSDPAEKLKAFKQAEEKIKQIENLEKESSKLILFADSLENLKADKQAQLEKMNALEEKMNALPDEETQAIEILVQNKNELKEIFNKPALKSDVSISNSIATEKSEQKKLKETKQNYVATQQNIEEEIKKLIVLRNGQKTKDQEKTQDIIDSKQREIDLIKQEIQVVTKKIENKTAAIEQAENKLTMYRNVHEQKETLDLDANTLKEQLSENKSTNFSTLSAYITQQKQELEKQVQPEISSNSKQNELVQKLNPSYVQRISSIEDDPSLNTQQKLKLVYEEELKLREILDQEEKRLRFELEFDPDNEEKLFQLLEITELKDDNQERILLNETAISEINQAQNSNNNTPKTPAETSKEHAKKLDEISSDNSINETKRAELLRIEEERHAEELSQKIEQKRKIAESNPEIQEEIEELEQLKLQSENRLKIVENQKTSSQFSGTEVINSLKNNHEKTIVSIEANDVLSEKEKLSKVYQEEVKLMKALDSELKKTNDEFAKNPTSSELAAKKQALEQIKSSKRRKSIRTKTTFDSRRKKYNFRIGIDCEN
jgi:epidermal growth factor receptor substrate 15